MTLRRLMLVTGLALSATACEEKMVRVGLHDANPPSLSLFVVTGKERMQIVGSSDAPVRVQLPVDGNGYLVAVARDSMGVKAIQISGSGNDVFSYTTLESAPVVVESRDTTPEGIGVDYIATCAKAMFTGREAVLRAQATDWAGNTITSPHILLTRNPKPQVSIVPQAKTAAVGGKIEVAFQSQHASRVVINRRVMGTFNGSYLTDALNGAHEIVCKAYNEFDSAEARAWVYGLPVNSPPIIGKVWADPPAPAQKRHYRVYWDVSPNGSTVDIPALGISGAPPSGNKEGFLTANSLQFGITARNSKGVQEQQVAFSPGLMDGCLDDYGNWGSFVVIGDLRQGKVLMAQNPHGKRPIISIKNETSMSLVVEAEGIWDRLAPGAESTKFAGISSGAGIAVIAPDQVNLDEMKKLWFKYRGFFCDNLEGPPPVAP